MKTNPITPPPELLDQWCMDATLGSWRDIATQAAQWGADQELEACVEWFDNQSLVYHRDLEYALRAARRPKPPSLKEQALDELIAAERLYPADWSTIRRALEALDD